MTGKWVDFEQVRLGKWVIHQNDDGSYPNTQVYIALLQDIREQLVELSSLVRNGRYDLLSELRAIKRNTARLPKPNAKPKVKRIGAKV